MIREVDLVSYFPQFLQEYKEQNSALTAENPEFTIIWDATDRVLKNEFISTADEYGISRFEKILDILPYAEDTLESRRARVQSRWFTSIPYTIKSLLAKLVALCGENNF
ncbi:MAG: putative phage tail protein, partial [Acinetobacter sp.]